jgi:hypothetical protein
VFERRLEAWSSPFAEASEQRVCHGCHDAAIARKLAVLPGSLPSNAATPPPMASDSRTLGRRAAEIRTRRLVAVETGPWVISSIK